MKSKKIVIVILNVAFVLMALSNVFSKLAAAEAFLSFRYCIFQCLTIGTLGIFAIIWQQIIKKIPLTVAYANKAVIIGWGMLFGVLFFNDIITFGQVIGAVIVIAGVILFSVADGEMENE